MKFKDFVNEDRPLLEGKNLRVFEALLPYFLLNEDGEVGEPVGDTNGPPEVPNLGIQPTPPTTPVGQGWYRPGPFRPGGMGMNGNHWFNELYHSLKSLAVASKISKRLKELGITGDGAARVRTAQKSAAKHVKSLLTNPGATAYRIPVWTTKAPPKPVIKKWNEEYTKAFALELSKINLMESSSFKPGDKVTIRNSKNSGKLVRKSGANKWIVKIGKAEITAREGELKVTE